MQCPLNTGFTVHISPSNDNMTVNSQLKELLSTFKRWECQFLKHVGCNISEHCTYFTIVSFNSWGDVCNRFYQLNNVDVDEPHVLSK